MAEERVCVANRKAVERMYFVFLLRMKLIIQIGFLFSFCLVILIWFVRLVGVLVGLMMKLDVVFMAEVRFLRLLQKKRLLVRFLGCDWAILTT